MRNSLLVATTTGLLLAAVAAWACPDREAAEAAWRTGDVDQAAALYERIEIDAACSDSFRNWLAYYLASTYTKQAAAPSLSPTERRTALETALRYGEHWRTLAALGQLDFDAKDYSAAAARYQVAITRLAEGPVDETATQQDVDELRLMASSSLALADDFVEPPVTRSGRPGGVFTTAFRGFKVEEIHLPITFVFDSTDFDEKGALYAEALSDFLNSQQPTSIVLEGHTDTKGTEDYNQDLSERRAEKVREFVTERGYRGRIEIVGYGETVEPEVPESIDEGTEEFDRLSRRVNLKLG